MVRKRVARRLRWEATRATAAFEELCATRLHDLLAARRTRRTPGAVQPEPDVAIYVIYPVAGLLASHLSALGYLARSGYAPIVVANAPLQPKERAQVADACWFCLERKNFGYDFGGYRAGILSLGPRLSELRSLVLMNDSVWFPLPGARDWLADAAAMEVDLAGAASNYAATRPALADYRGAVWDYDSARPGFHYCSFALRFGGRVLRDPGFEAFWRNFALSDSKLRTVRRGELGLTAWLIERGYSHAATLGMETFGDEIAGLDAAELKALVAGLVIPEDNALRELRDRVLGRAACDRWRSEAAALVLTAVAHTGIAYALPRWAYATRGHGLLKKSSLHLDPASAREILHFLGSLRGPEAEAILSEARRIAARSGADHGQGASGPRMRPTQPRPPGLSCPD